MYVDIYIYTCTYQYSICTYISTSLHTHILYVYPYLRIHANTLYIPTRMYVLYRYIYIYIYVYIMLRSNILISTIYSATIVLMSF